MRKLKLDELQVESFHTSADTEHARGTVRGNYTGYATCDHTCNDTCKPDRTLCGAGCGWSASPQGCHPGPGTGSPTLQGESCNWTCDFRQCASGQEVTCDGYACMGDTDGIAMC